MRALKIIIIALAILLPSYAFSEDLGTLRITLIEGDAYVYASDGEEWADASANMPIEKDDSLWVPEGGRMELHVRGGAVARLDEKTAMDVLDIEEESVRFYLDEGRLYVNSSLGGYTGVTVQTKSSSISIPDGSIVMIYASTVNTTRVSVIKGYADVESGLGKTRVNAGSSLRAGEELYADISPTGEPGEWERWNRNRDREITGPFESARYLPEELDEYAYDFDGNGTWVYANDYGYVWRPSIAISIGWAPYRHGRWAWYGGDYVWISYERWGWVPYHYGRWSYVSSIGWCWLPPRHREVYWGPGFVAWTYTPTYVAWVPLAPGEIYYGHRYYGPGTVNIVDIDIHKTVINNYYGNAHVKDSYTALHRDTFLGGKKVNFKLRENPFLSKRQPFGPPDMRPERHEGRRIAMKGFDEKRFSDRLAQRNRDNIQRREGPRKDERVTRPATQRSGWNEGYISKTETKRPVRNLNEQRPDRNKETSRPAVERSRKYERPSANIGRPDPKRERKEQKITDIKGSPKFRPDAVRKERPSAKPERPGQNKASSGKQRPEVKESPKLRPDAATKERPSARPERPGQNKASSGKQRPEVKESPKFWPSSTGTEKRIGKLDRETRPAATGGKPKSELRKPMAPAPQAYGKGQPKAAKPAAPQGLGRRQAPQNSEKAVKAERGRSNSSKPTYKEKDRGRDEGTSPSSGNGGRGWSFWRK